MASPVDSARPTTSVSSGATSANVSTGSPAVNNLLVVAARWAGSMSAPVFSGFNTLLSLNTSDASDDSFAVFWKVATGSEGADEALSWTTAIKGCMICWVITGADTSRTPGISTVSTFTTTANTANTNSANVAGGSRDALYLSIIGWDGETAAATALTNYTNIVNANSGTSGAVGTNCHLAGASRQISASSSDDPGAWTHPAANSAGMGVTVAIGAPDPPNPPIQNWAQGLGATY